MRAPSRRGRCAAELALGGEGDQHLGREDLGDGVQAEKAVAVGRLLVALLCLAIAEDEAAVAAHDNQDHAWGAGSHEHGGAGEAGCIREDRIGRRLFRRAGGGGRHKCEKV